MSGWVPGLGLMGPKGGPMGPKERAQRKGTKKGAQRKGTIFIDGPSMNSLMDHQWIHWWTINEFIDGPSMNSLMEIHWYSLMEIHWSSLMDVQQWISMDFQFFEIQFFEKTMNKPLKNNDRKTCHLNKTISKPVTSTNPKAAHLEIWNSENWKTQVH